MSQVALTRAGKPAEQPVPPPADQKPQSRAQTVLTNIFLARLIASFSDNRCGDVNRTLHAASGHVMVQRFPQFILAQRESEDALALACGQMPNVDTGELLKWADKISDECRQTIVTGDVIGPKPNDDHDKAVALQARTRELCHRFTIKYFNPLRQRLNRDKPETRLELLRACACLFDIKNQVHFIPHAQTKAADKNERLEKTIARLTTYMAEEGLAERIRIVFRSTLSAETMASKFKGLSNNQRRAVRCDNGLIQQFHECAERHQRSYSYEQFVAYEMLALEGEEASGRNMENFKRGAWNAVRNFGDFSYDGFLDHAENQQVLDQVQTLLLHHVNLNDYQVMEHLCKFRNLTTLDIRCNNLNYAMKDLPDELATFPYLRCLILEGHAFSKIPDVLARMPNLLILDLWNNRAQVEELPEDFTRHYLGGWASLALDQLRDLAIAMRFITNGQPGPGGVILDKLSNYHTLCLSPDKFRRIPFSLWFREHFSVPYIPSLAFGALLGATGVGNRVAEIIFAGTPVRYNDVVDFLLLLPFALLTFALNIPIFPVNVIITRVIEPIVSWVRESCCGCDPMVEL